MHVRAARMAQQAWIPHKLCVGEDEPHLMFDEARRKNEYGAWVPFKACREHVKITNHTVENVRP